MKTSIFTSFLIALLLTKSTLTWHSLGHLTVARIASLRLDMTPTGKKAKAWANAYLAPYSAVCGEKYYPFTECATWPDKIKEQDWFSMFNWHFDDAVYNKPGYNPKPKQVVYANQNVTWAIWECHGHLSSTKEDVHGKSKSSLGKSISVRNLIHFVGDIHQPLHTTGRFSKELPNGDEGGNLFPIKHYDDPTWNNLHFIWDHLFDQGKELDSPLSSTDFLYVTKFANRMMDTTPYDSVKDQVETYNKPEDWAAEGYKLVSTFVYDGITEGEELPLEYINKGKEIVNKRIALAGYRLANMFVDIYTNFINGIEDPEMVQ